MTIDSEYEPTVIDGCAGDLISLVEFNTIVTSNGLTDDDGYGYAVFVPVVGSPRLIDRNPVRPSVWKCAPVHADTTHILWFNK